MKYIAFTTKGLEKIASEEIKKLCKNGKILEIKDKRVIFETEVDLKSLTTLKTVDDIGLIVSTSLNQLKEIDLENFRKIIGQFRKIPDNIFSLTVGIVGVQGLKNKDIIDAVKKIVEGKYRWKFAEFDHTGFDIRVFADHKDFYISVRITADSLHHRTYKIASQSGSLRPTVAAAMVQLAANSKPDLKVVDNFCGSGTILCEAFTVGCRVFGGDIDNNAVIIAEDNLSRLGYRTEETIKRLNATNTNWPDESFDCAISNLPWDKQIQVSSITDLYQETLKEYSRILKPNGKLCLLATKSELLIKYIKQYFPDKEISLFPIGLLGQNPTIVLVS